MLKVIHFINWVEMIKRDWQDHFEGHTLYQFSWNDKMRLTTSFRHTLSIELKCQIDHKMHLSHNLKINLNWCRMSHTILVLVEMTKQDWNIVHETQHIRHAYRTTSRLTLIDVEGHKFDKFSWNGKTRLTIYFI